MGGAFFEIRIDGPARVDHGPIELVFNESLCSPCVCSLGVPESTVRIFRISLFEKEADEGGGVSDDSAIVVDARDFALWCIIRSAESLPIL